MLLIKNFSEITNPLVKLLKQDAKFIWNSECDKDFQLFKDKLICPHILQFSNFNESFIKTTDASQNSLGAVMSQGIIGKDLPIAYASRNLSKAIKKLYNYRARAFSYRLWRHAFWTVFVYKPIHYCY